MPIGYMTGEFTMEEEEMNKRTEVMDKINALGFDSWDIYCENGKALGFAVTVDGEEFYVFENLEVKSSDWEVIGEIAEEAFDSLHGFLERFHSIY